MDQLGARPGHAVAPGRVNLIGDHTDYNAGVALPVALDLRTEVRYRPEPGSRLVIRSDAFPQAAVVDLRPSGAGDRVSPRGQPAWAGLLAALWEELGLKAGGSLEVRSELPVGAGLSSSAALVVAVLGALGAPLEPWPVARICQRAEGRAGASVGLMDPLVAVAGRSGQALLVDFAATGTRLVSAPFGPEGEAELVVVHSGESRHLAGSPYGLRRGQCEAAAAQLGHPLGQAGIEELAGLAEPLGRRARHVVTECRRVRAFVAALEAGDLTACGHLLNEGHESLRSDFESSTPAVDALVAELTGISGVLGARLSGGGFGGCVVALARPGALDPDRWPGRVWRVRPSDGAAGGPAP